MSESVYEYEEPDFAVPVQEPVRVHVINAHELHTPVKDPPEMHVVTRTWTDVGSVLEILQQDPLRVKTEFFISGVGTIFICHSQTQAQAALTGGGGNFGAAITCPGAAGSIRYTDYSQAKIWAVLTGASPVLAIISERKD